MSRIELGLVQENCINNQILTFLPAPFGVVYGIRETAGAHVYRIRETKPRNSLFAIIRKLNRISNIRHD